LTVYIVFGRIVRKHGIEYCGKSHDPTTGLEAVASKNLWIGHYFFGKIEHTIRFTWRRKWRWTILWLKTCSCSLHRQSIYVYLKSISGSVDS
jgi:hypothetical protein